jgi:paraquat-inducible protein A
VLCCPRCAAVLVRRPVNSVERSLALSVAGLILFLVANSFPFLAFDMQGQVTQTTLASGVIELWGQGRYLVSSLVLLTTIVAPAAQLSIVLYLLTPIRMGRTPPLLAEAYRVLHHLQPWSMMEVFLIGILVSLVKLADMAEIIPGISLWAFALLIPVVAAASRSLDPEIVWSRVEVRS